MWTYWLTRELRSFRPPSGLVANRLQPVDAVLVTNTDDAAVVPIEEADAEVRRLDRGADVAVIVWSR